MQSMTAPGAINEYFNHLDAESQFDIATMESHVSYLRQFDLNLGNISLCHSGIS
jgi:hypothetical protein